MESVYTEDRLCCGCNACTDICPQKAIIMKEDKYGYEYPTIIQEACINCGKCRSVCPMINVSGHSTISAYAAVLNDKAIINSASGGAFYALAKAFLKNEGIVFGCAFDNQLHVSHVEIDHSEDIEKLQGSKYVQSHIECYGKVKELVANQKPVLFSGTPCQIAAIKKSVGINCGNLYCVEIVCHGVPNQKLWTDYIKFLEKKHRGRVTSFQFRCKDVKRKFCAKYTVERKGKTVTYILPSVVSYYYYNFLKGKNYRESCYSCPFASPKRQADITICDYWGYEGERFRGRSDISAILIQGEKGNRLFEMAKPLLLCEPTSFDQVSKQNEQLRIPSSKDKYSVTLMDIGLKKGATGLEREHFKRHWKAYIANKIGILN